MIFGPKTFRGKLLLALLAFVLLAELVIAGAVLDTTYDQTMSQARARLRVGHRVLKQLIQSRGTHLLSTVNVLASDFGFKSAVATHDKPTQRTVLANFGNRVDADIAVLASRSGALTTAIPTSLVRDDSPAFRKLLAQARRTGGAVGLSFVGERAYQLTFTPVEAPRLIAWVGMGFKIDAQLAQRLTKLTGLQVEFVGLQNSQALFRTGTLAGNAGGDRDAALADGSLIGSRATLMQSGDTRLDAVLALDRESVLSGYSNLAYNLALIFVLTLLVSTLVAFWMARRISRPVQQLSRFAESVAAGAYARSPISRQDGELSVLATTLNTMRDAVQNREQRIRHQATHDALTDLPNRASMRETAQQFLDDKRRGAAVRISISGFSRIVETLGHQLSDDVLATVAQRLRAVFDDADPVARIDGNDFLVLISGDKDAATVRFRLAGLRPKLEAPVRVADTSITLALAFGIVMVPDHADDLETLWRRTVLARNASHTDGDKPFFYRGGMDEHRMRELTLIQGLAPALDAGDLHLVFQPKMSLANGEVRQVEALTRWVHPTLGFIPPDEFIGLAEGSGQIKLLTRWLIQRLTEQIGRWRDHKISLGIALNLSADELADAHLTRSLAPLLAAASPAQPITLEVTESALLRDPTLAMANLAELQKLGALIAVDDFGTGYSSLAQLKQLAADELKIDKSLVLKLDTTPADQFIVRMIIDLGHKLGMQVIAEGVENIESRDYLAQLGADAIQGYWLAKPMQAPALEAWLGELGQRPGPGSVQSTPQYIKHSS